LTWTLHPDVAAARRSRGPVIRTHCQTYMALARITLTPGITAFSYGETRIDATLLRLRLLSGWRCKQQNNAARRGALDGGCARFLDGSAGSGLQTPAYRAVRGNRSLGVAARRHSAACLSAPVVAVRQAFEHRADGGIGGRTRRCAICCVLLRMPYSAFASRAHAACMLTRAGGLARGRACCRCRLVVWFTTSEGAALLTLLTRGFGVYRRRCGCDGCADQRQVGGRHAFWLGGVRRGFKHRGACGAFRLCMVLRGACLHTGCTRHLVRACGASALMLPRCGINKRVYAARMLRALRAWRAAAAYAPRSVFAGAAFGSTCAHQRARRIRAGGSDNAGLLRHAHHAVGWCGMRILVSGSRGLASRMRLSASTALRAGSIGMLFAFARCRSGLARWRRRAQRAGAAVSYAYIAAPPALACCVPGRSGCLGAFHRGASLRFAQRRARVPVLVRCVFGATAWRH